MAAVDHVVLGARIDVGYTPCCGILVLNTPAKGVCESITLMVDWSEIGEDITTLFIERLPGIQDFLRFSYVCKLWRYVAMERKQRQGFCSSIPLAPWLMLTEGEDNHTRSFFRTNPEKTISFPLPQAQRSRCWGSPYGWIITVGINFNINLLHPLSQTQISLPPVPNLLSQSKLQPLLLSRFKERVSPAQICVVFLWKFCLLSTPTPPSNDCLVVALFSAAHEVAFVRPGDESWICLESSLQIQDVILFKGQYYGVHHYGNLMKLCRLDEDIPKAINIADPPEDALPHDRFYLVEMLEQLHMVIRIFSTNGPTDTVSSTYCKTTGFCVFKFDFSTMEWDELEELGDHAIFVGNNTSFAISITTHPYFKRNCIYFTDDNGQYYKSNYADMGVYDYEEQTIEPIFSEDVFSGIYRPLFFMPTL